MIPFQETLKFAHKIPPEIIEKDYCLTWFLYGLSESILARDLVFYGGTALRKIYFPDYRFSEDLDFISDKDLKIEKILQELNRAYKVLSDKVNINFNTNEETVESNKDRIQFFVEYDGFPEISLKKQIKIDLLVKQELLDVFSKKDVLSPYSDSQKGKKLKAYSLESIVADKILAVAELSRQEPRDIYDLNYLLKEKQIDYSKIIKTLQNKLGYIIPLATLVSHLKSDLYRSRWGLRLKNQVMDLPDIKVVLKELKYSLKKLYRSYQSVVW